MKRPISVLTPFYPTDVEIMTSKKLLIMPCLFRIKCSCVDQITVEHTYDACPKYSKLGSFRIIAYLYVSEGSRRWQRQSTEKKVQGFYI